MSNSTPLDHSQQDAEGVRNFFDQWHIYRKVVDLNYLHHRETAEAIGKVISKITKPFSFIDLGAGDAEGTSRVLAGSPIKSYEAVDLSSIALGYAEKNLAALDCPKKFTQANFFEYVTETRSQYDIAFIGLSFHHLQREEKRRFYAKMRRILPSGGKYLFYEPICRSGEARDVFMKRWWDETFSKWDKMTPDELQKIWAHVSENDYPEPIEVYTEMALENGFKEANVLFVTDDKFYAAFECIAD
ncbi:MAG: class I SAM-dependent methyltransferase [Chthoniobacterales bacterium]